MKQRTTGADVLPGSANPYPAQSAHDISEHYAVGVDDVQCWLDAGLPSTGTGRDLRIDPMVCCNWLSHGNLHRAPVLARRWQRYQQFFRPQLRGADASRVITWKRQHRLCLPHELTLGEQVWWWLPRPQKWWQQ